MPHLVLCIFLIFSFPPLFYSPLLFSISLPHYSYFIFSLPLSISPKARSRKFPLFLVFSALFRSPSVSCLLPLDPLLCLLPLHKFHLKQQDLDLALMDQVSSCIVSLRSSASSRNRSVLRRYWRRSSRMANGMASLQEGRRRPARPRLRQIRRRGGGYGPVGAGGEAADWTSPLPNPVAWRRLQPGWRGGGGPGLASAISGGMEAAAARCGRESRRRRPSLSLSFFGGWHGGGEGSCVFMCGSPPMVTSSSLPLRRGSAAPPPPPTVAGCGKRQEGRRRAGAAPSPP